MGFFSCLTKCCNFFYKQSSKQQEACRGSNESIKNNMIERLYFHGLIPQDRDYSNNDQIFGESESKDSFYTIYSE